MQNVLELTKKEFESSSTKTPEYLAWHKTFKKEFTAFLKQKGATKIEISKSNHFDISGFFKIGMQIFWFRIEDLRWNKEDMLIRTATNFNDYTGGYNRYISLDNYEIFLTQFNEIIFSL